MQGWNIQQHTVLCWMQHLEKKRMTNTTKKDKLKVMEQKEIDERKLTRRIQH